MFTIQELILWSQKTIEEHREHNQRKVEIKDVLCALLCSIPYNLHTRWVHPIRSDCCHNIIVRRWWISVECTGWLYTLFVWGNKYGACPAAARTSRPDGQNELTNYCNELSHQFKARGIYFSVVDSPFTFAMVHRRRGMTNTPLPRVVVRYIRQQAPLMAVAPAAATIAQPLNVAPITVGTPMSAPVQNIPIAAVAVSNPPIVAAAPNAPAIAPNAPSNAQQLQNLDALYRQGVLDDEKAYEAARARLFQNM